MPAVVMVELDEILPAPQSRVALQARQKQTSACLDLELLNLDAMRRKGQQAPRIELGWELLSGHVQIILGESCIHISSMRSGQTTS